MLSNNMEMASCSSSESEGEKDHQKTRRKLSFGSCMTKGDNQSKRSPVHCSNCGHPGNKRDHMTSGCPLCENVVEGTDTSNSGCRKKTKGFQCVCKDCSKKWKLKKRRQQQGWWEKFQSKMAKTDGFPSEHIINIFLRPGLSNLADDGTPADLIKWHTPNLEGLEKFLALHLYWEPYYVRQRVLPLLSHACLKAMALREGSEQRPIAVESTEEMINGLFTPHSIERIKVDHFKPYYMLRWQCLGGHPSDDEWLGLGRKNSQSFKRDELEQEQVGLDDDANACTINVETGDLGSQCVFTTNENMELVKEACPKLVEAFLQDQAMKEELKTKKKKGSKRKKEESENTGHHQLSITTFFKCKKGEGNIRMYDSSYKLTLDPPDLGSKTWETSVSGSGRQNQVIEVPDEDCYMIKPSAFQRSAEQARTDCSTLSSSTKIDAPTHVRRKLFPSMH
jgi:flap endonuclease GEN